jgi:transposase
MVLVMDNARIHKAHKTIAMIEELDLKVFTLVPYSPEQNDIEHTFGMVKNKLSRMNHRARALDS